MFGIFTFQKPNRGQYYVYRICGCAPEKDHNFYNPDQWLLDPYAKAVAGAPSWGDTWGVEPGKPPKYGVNFPKGIIVDDTFDWSGDRRVRVPMADSIIYETHLRGFTNNANSGAHHRGTYRGLIEKIPHLKHLGITTVELLPINEFNEMEYHYANDPRKHLRNFWGYSTQSFFAPNGRYATGVQGQQVHEFKELVKALHQADIEIILDVVFNHTNEGGFGGAITSFRGIDNSIYYMLEEDGQHYRNYTGCGNTVNCNHPVVRQYILDCLRYWVLEMRVDGFRFDLASIFCRDQKGNVLENPPIVEEIANDPVLRDVKLIAEAWDAAGLYQVGSFPSKEWSEWNGRYRDDMRKFWIGKNHMLGTFATRFMGSPDLYKKNDQPPQKTINLITCHDGFTMYDLTAYNEKDNLANMEKNRDGENHNHSYNFGAEGPSRNPHIRAARKKQLKNYMATLLLSQGTPMILAGDEFGRTQGGNNNSYCQDNEISWVDWSRCQEFEDLIEFTREAIAFRKANPVLRSQTWITEENAIWHSPSGEKPDWQHDKAVACYIKGHSIEAPGQKDLFLIFNPCESAITFKLPAATDSAWEIALHSQEKQPHIGFIRHKTIKIQPISLAVLHR